MAADLSIENYRRKSAVSQRVSPLAWWIHAHALSRGQYRCHSSPSLGLEITSINGQITVVYSPPARPIRRCHDRKMDDGNRQVVFCVEKPSVKGSTRTYTNCWRGFSFFTWRFRAIELTWTAESPSDKARPPGRLHHRIFPIPTSTWAVVLFSQFSQAEKLYRPSPFHFLWWATNHTTEGIRRRGAGAAIFHTDSHDECHFSQLCFFWYNTDMQRTLQHSKGRTAKE